MHKTFELSNSFFTFRKPFTFAPGLITGVDQIYPCRMNRLKVSDILVEGATLEIEEVDFSQKPDVAALYQETKERQEELKKLKEVDEEQLKLVVQL